MHCNSMTEAKYVVVSDVVKEALWLGRLACTLQQANSNSTTIFYNYSQEVVALSKNLVHHNASKHINIQYHIVRDYITSKKLRLEKISIAITYQTGWPSVSQLTNSWHLGTRRAQGEINSIESINRDSLNNWPWHSNQFLHSNRATQPLFLSGHHQFGYKPTYSIISLYITCFILQVSP